MVMNQNIIFFQGERVQAIQYKQRRRSVDMAVYNRRRLREKPFPAMRSKKVVKNKRNLSKSSKKSKEQAENGRPISSNENATNAGDVDQLLDALDGILNTPPLTPQAVYDLDDMNGSSIDVS